MSQIPRQGWQRRAGQRDGLLFGLFVSVFLKVDLYSKKELLVKSEPLGPGGRLGLACRGTEAYD